MKELTKKQIKRAEKFLNWFDNNILENFFDAPMGGSWGNWVLKYHYEDQELVVTITPGDVHGQIYIDLEGLKSMLKDYYSKKAAQFDRSWEFLYDNGVIEVWLFDLRICIHTETPSVEE